MSDNPPFFINPFTATKADRKYSKKLMDSHQKNLDSFVSANKVVSDAYKVIANQQMAVFQEGLNKMTRYTAEQATQLAQGAFKNGTKQMQAVVETATQAHQEAYDILSVRAKNLISETQNS